MIRSSLWLTTEQQVPVARQASYNHYDAAEKLDLSGRRTDAAYSSFFAFALFFGFWFSFVFISSVDGERYRCMHSQPTTS